MRQDNTMLRTRAVRREADALLQTRGYPFEGSPPAHPEDAPVIAKARGATVVDVDGNEYIDYFLTRGVGMLGHADERLVVAVNKAIVKGTDLGTVSESAVRLAELVASRFSSIDRFRFVDSHGQAIMEVERLARAWTKRQVVIVFDGVYHAGLTAAMSMGTISSAEFVSLPFNDIEVVDRAFALHHERIAAVLVEPISTAHGLVPADIGWLNHIRRQCDQSESLLLSDETATGLALAPGCEFEAGKPDADIVVLGSILGGGLPMAGYGGRKALMGHPAATEVLVGPASTNRIAFEAGIASLQCLAEPSLYDTLDAAAHRLDQGLRTAAATAGLATQHVRLGGMVGLFFSRSSVSDSSAALATDGQRYDRFAAGMLERGVLCPLWPGTVWYLSAAHTNEQIDTTIASALEVFQELSHGRSAPHK